MTPEEKHLWYDFLKKLPFSVKRQKSIENYIVDFYIPKYKTVIEIDGIQHKKEENEKADRKRDEFLVKMGIKVLRYSNSDVNERFRYVSNNILENMGLKASDVMKRT